MSTDKANDFIPEHLAKWWKITREYLFVPIELLNRRRNMKALPTQDICLQCHGATDKLSQAVKTKLHELYPQDKAVGYGLAEIRGAMTLKRPL